MRSALLPVLIMSTSACGGKKDAPAPSPATGAVAAVIDAAPPPPPPTDAPPPPRITGKGGPWSIDVTKLTTIDKLAGFTTTPEWENSREPIMLSTLVDRDDDNGIGLVAYTPREGDDAGKIQWLETYATENAEVGENGQGYEAAGLCVEGVCPGQPAAAAEKLGVKTCDTDRIEMEFRYRCEVPGSPLVVLVEGEVPGAKAGRDMPYAKIVKAKHAIHSLAWEVTPGAWRPMIGCTTDCD